MTSPLGPSNQPGPRGLCDVPRPHSGGRIRVPAQVCLVPPFQAVGLTPQGKEQRENQAK